MGLSPSPMELAFLAVLALVILGPNKLPEAAKSLGKGFREMRDSFQGAVGDDDEDERFRFDDVADDDEDDEYDEERDETAAASADEADPDADHQKDADSSVPSASSSSTERE